MRILLQGLVLGLWLQWCAALVLNDPLAYLHHVIGQYGFSHEVITRLNDAIRRRSRATETVLHKGEPGQEGLRGIKGPPGTPGSRGIKGQRGPPGVTPQALRDSNDESNRVEVDAFNDTMTSFKRNSIAFVTTMVFVVMVTMLAIFLIKRKRSKDETEREASGLQKY
ncbi:hypothetical protein CAPTEDRAFT_197177 [Capitella teleta]|uniref:Uncharacterized protein n=1 Tax=Capitella teleta TaxID=283909 RepID=R7UJI7_CAPTE|nr:hypothetical protein CAPTEDRAFT_197177 [Capitella teleta]|eukprot:ELU03923.1 hypothetical protein CAPTEDRAFT_197177 [Capitella teleta]